MSSLSLTQPFVTFTKHLMHVLYRQVLLLLGHKLAIYVDTKLLFFFMDLLSCTGII